MEGGFSKALLMRKVDGTEVVAKLPFKISGPAHYTTASEVAVLKYGTLEGRSTPRECRANSFANKSMNTPMCLYPRS